jgi:RNA polymerase sigma factor (sigma-70 family)
LSKAARIQEPDFIKDTDADLLTLISWREEDEEGARRAWGEFYTRHFNFLSAVCLKSYGNRLGADGVQDLVNDTFLRVFTHGAHNFRTDQPEADYVRKLVRVWLCKIANSLFLMELRGRKRLPEVVFEESEHAAIEFTPLSLERETQCERVRELLAQLPEREYDVLMARLSNYHRNEGKQQFDPEVLSDLAERWQVTKDNVRQILSRSLRKIKDQLS